MCEQRVTILSEQGKQEWEGDSMGVRGSTDQLSLDLRKFEMLPRSGNA